MGANKQLIHEWLAPNGAVWLQMYRTDCAYLLRFPGLADYHVSLDGSKVYPPTSIQTSPQTLDHLLLNQVMPLAQSRQGKIVLHGSAIQVEDSALAFLGMTGRGKSTLTASFATAGYQFLTDDGLQITAAEGQYRAEPSHPSIRLWSDSEKEILPTNLLKCPPIQYSSKSRVLAGEALPHCSAAKILKAFYFLGSGETDQISVAPMTSRDAIIELVQHSFLLDIEEHQVLKKHFTHLSELVRHIPCFTLDYPRDYSRLNETRDKILIHFSQQTNQSLC